MHPEKKRGSANSCVAVQGAQRVVGNLPMMLGFHVCTVLDSIHLFSKHLLNTKALLLLCLISVMAYIADSVGSSITLETDLWACT